MSERAHDGCEKQYIHEIRSVKSVKQCHPAVTLDDGGTRTSSQSGRTRIHFQDAGFASCRTMVIRTREVSVVMLT